MKCAQRIEFSGRNSQLLNMKTFGIIHKRMQMTTRKSHFSPVTAGKVRGTVSVEAWGTKTSMQAGTAPMGGSLQMLTQTIKF